MNAKLQTLMQFPVTEFFKSCDFARVTKVLTTSDTNNGPVPFHPISISVSLLALVMFVGCSGNTEPKPASGSKTNGSNSSSPTSNAKEKTNASVPDGFPNDVYIADGAKVVDFKKSGGKDNLILEYPESDIDEFVTSYLDGMTEKGWTQVTSSKLPIGTITNFSKDDRKCTISISPPKDKVIKVAIMLPNSESD